MTKIPVQCPSCRKRYAAPANRAGQSVKCPNCQNPILIASQAPPRAAAQTAIDLLRQCADDFGPPPRSFSAADQQAFLNAPRPRWLLHAPDDEIRRVFDNLPSVFVNGIVVWGHVVQANSLLFEPNPHDCPGELVYSIEDCTKTTPSYLKSVAQKLFSLKGTQPDRSELRSIADYLTDERIRVFGLPVPAILSPTIRCRISTTYFIRQHLPNGMLRTLSMPIVVNPGQPFVAMPLPTRYWPLELQTALLQ